MCTRECVGCDVGVVCVCCVQCWSCMYALGVMLEVCVAGYEVEIGELGGEG